MTITLRLFASLREKAGRPALSLEVPEGATVGELLTVAAREVRLEPAILAQVRPAVNQEYTDAGHVLADGDEVALIPPVSGG